VDQTQTETRALRIALLLNGAMFVIGTAAGLLADSIGLLADALDMLADAGAYGLSLAAIGRSGLFKARVAGASGAILILLGTGVLVDAFRRAFSDSQPESAVILLVSLLSLAVNAYVIRMLTRLRRHEVHIRAAWLFTRADVVANMAVLTAGVLVMFTGSRFPDILAGLGVGCYVMFEGAGIVRNARHANTKLPPP
jgi:cation diffusion facilitator family transporter